MTLISMKSMFNTKSRIPILGILGVIQFVILSTIAMASYPGGTPWDPTAVGYTFWQNALSDLGRTVAYNGQGNPIASPLFNSALFLLGLSTFLIFISLLFLVFGLKKS